MGLGLGLGLGYGGGEEVAYHEDFRVRRGAQCVQPRVVSRHGVEAFVARRRWLELDDARCVHRRRRYRAVDSRRARWTLG